MSEKIEVKEFEEFAIIHLNGSFHSGEFDFTREIKSIIKDLLDREIKKILIDFSKVSFFGSDGIGALTNGHYTACNLGGRLVPYALPDYLKSAFTLVGLDKVFPNFSTEEEALEYLKKKVK